MVRTTERITHALRSPLLTARFLTRLAALWLIAVALVVAAGCSGGSQPQTSSGESGEESATVGAHMGGPAVDVNVTQETVDNKPKPWVLTTPEAAVRSYLDWTSYAYRIGQAQVALPTMSSYEEVRVDSYVQYNIQKLRLIDQSLDSITFDEPSVEASSAVISAKETWTYRYVSIETAGKTLEGPYSASYDTTYTLVKSAEGTWVVDKVEAEALDTVK